MSPFTRKFKTKKTPTLSNKLVRLPDGTLHKCEKKVREQNINDLRNIAIKIGFERDLQFFFISKVEKLIIFTNLKNLDGLHLLPSCFPRKPTALLNHISKVYFLYNLCEQSVAKCLSLENPKDITDTHLLNDVVLTNRNNLQSNLNDANAAMAILDSEDAVVRLLTTLLSLPELTTQWYRVKDQTGKVCQLGITCNGLVLRPEFDSIETGRVSWADIGSPRIQRSNVRLPLVSSHVATDPTVSSFVQRKKSKRPKSTSKKVTKSQNTVREYGDVESAGDLLDANDGAELVFCVSESATAKRMAYQLNCSRSYALSEGFHEISRPIATQESSNTQNPGALARFNRQFRDTFRRVAKPFSKKSKKAAESKDDIGDTADDKQSTAEAPETSVLADTADSKPGVTEKRQIPSTSESPSRSYSPPFSQTQKATIQNSMSPAPEPIQNVRTSVNTQQMIPEVSAAITGIPATTTTVSSTGGTGTITQTFHISHNLPHGTSFQTHGSVTPVSSRVLQEVPTEPIGVVSAGEADFTLDECDDRMLHSFTSPIFDSTKVTRTPQTIAVPTSPNVYSLGIKPSLIQPVTPTSPSSVTSFSAGAPPQSPPGASLSTRSDRSPTDDSTAQVSAILSQCVKSREGPLASDPAMQARMDASREFCTNVLAQVINPATDANLNRSTRDVPSAPSPSMSATAAMIEPEISSDVVVVMTGANAAAVPVKVEPAQNAERQSSTPSNSPAKSEISPTRTTSLDSTKLVEVNQTHTDSLSSFGQTGRPSTYSESHKSIVNSSTPVSETTTTIASQLYTSSTTTITHNGTTASTTPVIQDGPAKPVSLSSFGLSRTSSEISADGEHSKTVVTSVSNAGTTISPSTSFQSRLKPPTVSVARANPPTNADALSRTPEFPAPYRPVVSGLLAPKIMPPSLPNSEQVVKQSTNGNVSGTTGSDLTQANMLTVQTVSTSLPPTNSSQTDDISPNPSTLGPTRVSGIKPPSVKVPGSTLEQPQTAPITRPVSATSPHAVTNGSNSTACFAPSGRYSLQETAVTQSQHAPSQLKQPEVKPTASGIQPPSVVAVTASSPPPPPHTGSGLVRPSTVPQSVSNGSNGTSPHLPKNGSISASVCTGVPSGIRPPSRVPKPNINRA